MTRRLGAAALLAAASLLPAPRAALAQAAAPVAEFTAGGITVVHKPVAANDVVAVRLYLKGGSAALTPATAGIERLMGEAATLGTEKYDKDRFAALATSTGTEIAAQADFDWTVITAQGVRQNWAEAWDLFTQAALHPSFPADEIEQTRAQLLDALRRNQDDPDARLDELADSVLYAGHAYAIDPQGTAEALGRITRDELAAWHERRFTKANLLLVVVGNVSRADLEAKVAAAFGGLPAAGGEAPGAPQVAAARKDLTIVTRALPTNYVMGAYAAPAPSSPDFPAFRVATRVLSESLFEEVRTKRNLSYAVSAGLATRAANRGNIYVTAVQPDSALSVMLGEVRKLKDGFVPANRIGQAVNVYLTGYLMAQQTNMGQGRELGMWELEGGGWENAARYGERLRAVTPQEVQRVARLYFQNARFVVIGDGAKVDRTLFTSLD